MSALIVADAIFSNFLSQCVIRIIYGPLAKAAQGIHKMLKKSDLEGAIYIKGCICDGAKKMENKTKNIKIIMFYKMFYTIILYIYVGVWISAEERK